MGIPYKKILTLGHSLALDACHMLAAVAAAEGEQLELATLYDSGCPLFRHVEYLREGTRGYSLHVSSTEEPGLPPKVLKEVTMEEAKRLTEQIEGLQPTVDGCSIEISGGVNRPPFETTPANRALFEKAKEIGNELGMDVRSITVGGGSDGNFTSAWGIPTLDGLGPMGDGAHAVNEHILISESLENTVLLSALLQQL